MRMTNTNVEEIEGRLFIPGDWYPGSLPGNVVLAEHAYPESAFSFSSFHSGQPEGFRLGYASGIYDCGHIMAGKEGKITIGRFVILNALNIICNRSVTVGDHCMFGWGSIVTDSWLPPDTAGAALRKEMLRALAHTPERYLDCPAYARPVVIEANVWVGFGAVILPGVTIGRGAIIGCKTIITEDVPPYAVVGGNPARTVRFLDPTDTEEARTAALDQLY